MVRIAILLIRIFREPEERGKTMETSIFERDGKTWTRFKVKVKELRIYARLLKKWVDINKPVKQSSRYIYFEVESDLLNN